MKSSYHAVILVFFVVASNYNMIINFWCTEKWRAEIQHFGCEIPESGCMCHAHNREAQRHKSNPEYNPAWKKDKGSQHAHTHTHTHTYTHTHTHTHTHTRTHTHTHVHTHTHTHTHTHAHTHTHTHTHTRTHACI